MTPLEAPVPKGSDHGEMDRLAVHTDKNLLPTSILTHGLVSKP